jgi:hypothetical protein
VLDESRGYRVSTGRHHAHRWIERAANVCRVGEILYSRRSPIRPLMSLALRASRQSKGHSFVQARAAIDRRTWPLRRFGQRRGTDVDNARVSRVA